VDEAYISNAVLRWARERSGATEAQLADALKVKPEQIQAWEKGETFPPFGKAQELAKRLYVPFGYLFLSEPPDEKPPIPDLRTLDPNSPQKPSPGFLDLLNDVLVKQLWYREHQKEIGEAPLPFVGRWRRSDGVQRVAEDIRNKLRVANLRSDAGSFADFLRLIVRSAEDLGVLVMRSGIVGGNTRRKLSVEEFRGFAVSDELAPLVFINSRDPLVAQIFTFAHEIAHIWIGESAISNIDPWELPKSQRNGIEQFCDSVAAETLVPATEFVRQWRGADEGQLQALATHFRVSSMVIIRRAFELDRITSSLFYRLLAEEKERQAARALAAASKKSGGGSFYNTLPSRNSARLTNSVLESLQSGRVPYLEAARLLGVKAFTLTTLLEGHRGRTEG
jgi:Zn-dependent peptidase ImmA (M78 family)/DNA-binding XRE family transcriptional regulator